jgi:tetratricopeptide (TPR) repeat protein
MSSLFEQLNDSDPSSVRDALEMPQPDVDSAAHDYTNEKMKDDTVVADLDELKDAGVPSTVSGTDITSQLDSLFGDPEQSAVNTQDMVSDFTQPYDPNALRKNAFESPAPEDISVAATQEYKLDEMTTSGDVSGSDVTARLNEMFADDVSAEQPIEDMGSIFNDQENDLPVADSPVVDATEQLTKESVSLPPDLSPEIDIADTNIGRDQTKISGDDVALRLDTIFDNEENGGDMQQSSFDTAVADDVASYEETRSPVEQDAAPDVDNVEKYSASIDDESDTMIQNETGMIPAQMQEEDTLDEINAEEKKVQVPAIDDTLSVESSPEMSGDDVAARLDKLFAKSFESTDDVSSIPEEDQKNDDVGQGFYTMSGDNAETASSDDVLLSELDKTDCGAQFVDPDEAEDMSVDEQKSFVFQPPQLEAPDEVIDKADDRDATIPIHSSGDDVDEQEYAIPDHVLTPTLADIYYQQGQFTLALRMYQRLLESDPDNERLSGRVKEIERAIDIQINSPEGAQMPDLDESDMPKRKTNTIRVPEKSQSAKPLAGVRIKKKYKNRVRKSGRKKRGA